MKIKPVAYIVLAVLVALAFIAGISWVWLQERSCDAPTADQIFALSASDIDAYNRREKESFRISTEDKQRVIAILKRNTEGWTIPWDSQAYQYKMEFSRGSEKLLTLGIGRNFISRGWCFKKLNSVDNHQMHEISIKDPK